MIGQTISHYKILEKLGEGGMGVVYKAEDLKLKRQVALKLLPPAISGQSKERERFLIEAQAAAALNHPNIATIFGIEEVDDDLFMEMEYIEGQELKARVEAGAISVDEIARLATQIVQGLRAAHQKGISHRDIKSTNIMLTAEGRIKIMDFGLARIGAGSNITREGVILGTIAYMSPEQAQGQVMDHRTDIWSFGAVLYEMATGRLPFEANYDQAVIYLILNAAPPAPSSLRQEIPESLNSIILKALEKNLDRRYQTMDEELADLEKMKMPEGAEFVQIHPVSGQTAKSKTPSTGTSAERRQITALSYEIEAQEVSVEQIDPEELLHVLPAYRDHCNQALSRFEGRVVETMGNRVLVFFGYPAAHEDDAQRGVRAGLSILKGVQDLNSRLNLDKKIEVSVRVGIHTGLVVTEDDEKQTFVGEAPNVANRITDMARSNSVVITASTNKLVKGFFHYKDLGTKTIKGFSAPLALYQILDESASRTRLEVGALAGLTPLAGRDQEFGLIHNRWEQVQEKIGGIVHLTGDPGIGKSRLLNALKEQVTKEPKAWLMDLRCSQYYSNSALFPVIEFFQEFLLFKKEDLASVKLNKLEDFLTQFGISLAESAPLLATLLSIPTNGQYPPLQMTPERQKQKTIETIVTILLTVASSKTVLVSAEDLHWADPSTLYLLTHLMQSVSGSHLLVLTTSRPEFTLPSTIRAEITSIRLTKLSRKAVHEIVSHVSGGKLLPAEIMDQLAMKSDGVPLFVEEMTKMILESGQLQDRGDRYEIVGSLSVAIPSTLKDSLMARLDHLASVKPLAQLGATIGREFSFELMREVMGIDEDAMEKGLTQLVEAELIQQRGIPPEASYVFKHALIQDAAYESLLKSSRQLIHHKIAQTLESKFPQAVETQPEILAHHYASANLIPQSIPYWHRAGHLALQRSANLEAIKILTHALGLLEGLPDSLERTQQELLLQVTLGPALIATKGFGAADVGEVYHRADALCQQLGDTPLLFPALWGQWVYNLVRANLSTAQRFAEQLLQLGESKNDPAILVEGHWTLGNALFWLGEFESAEQHLKKALEHYDPTKHHVHAFIFGQDPSVAAHCYLSYVSWYRGYPDQALQETVEVLDLAQSLKHPFSIGWGLAFGMMVAGFRNDHDLTVERTARTIQYCTEQAYPFWLFAAMIYQGWALFQKGKPKDGIELMRNGLQGFQAIGSEVVEPLFQGLLAEALGKNGQAEEAMEIVDKALTKARRNQEKASEIDLHRVKGELLLMAGKGNHAEAEASFLNGIELSKETGAKMRELQVTISLSRLWSSQGKKEQAKTKLREIYGWFTEGFDSEALQNAQNLLKELE